MASSRLERIGTIFSRAEGLITRGAIKPDDRPLWFDIYRAFPPINEPKFARPKPEIKPIRQILYTEDAIRVKFHAKRHGLGAVNMLNLNSESHTKKLVQQYEKLESEGVPENELIEKSVASVEMEHQPQEPSRYTKESKIHKDSATAQILSEANLKDIFKEN